MGIQTRAVREGNDYVINGSKHFISCATRPDFVILFTVTGVDETPKGPRKRITAFLVDSDTKGFDISRGPRSVSHRSYHNYQFSFAAGPWPRGISRGARARGSIRPAK